MPPRHFQGPPTEPGWYILVQVREGLRLPPVRRFVGRTGDGRCLFFPDPSNPHDLDVRDPSCAGWEWEGPFTSRQDTYYLR